MLQKFRIDRLPETIEEFVALRDQIGHTPQGGAAMMIVALLLYAEDNALGKQCLTVAVDRDRLMEGIEGYRGWQLRRRDMQREYIYLTSQVHQVLGRGRSPVGHYLRVQVRIVYVNCHVQRGAAHLCYTTTNAPESNYAQCLSL